MEIEKIKQYASQTRRDILRMVATVNSGHPGGSLGCTDFFAVMYHEILRYDAKNFTIDGKGEDLFFLSNGHISPVWYSTLARNGFFPVDELATFRKIDSRLQGHPSVDHHLPGIRAASGSLGQGLSMAIGAAQTKKLNKDNHLIYVLMGDGELQEGQVWEAAMNASGKKVDNLIATIDYNGRQIDGDTDDVMPLGDLKKKWEAFGWITLEVDGHNIEELIAIYKKAQSLCGQGHPVLVLMKTEMGQGVDFMMGTHAWHGKAPNKEQLEDALGQLEETLGDY